MTEIVYVRDANGNLVQTTIEDLGKNRLEQLEEENKKLNIKVASLEGEIKGLNYTIDRLHKEIEELEKPHPRFSDFGGYDLDNNK